MGVNVREFAIRAGAANECMRAAQDLEKVLKLMGDNNPAEEVINLAIKTLNVIGDKLSMASDEELAHVSEAQRMAADGSLLKEMRADAIERFNSFIVDDMNAPAYADLMKEHIRKAIEGEYRI